MIRLFAAIGLPHATAIDLSMLGGGVPGARWVPTENFHITLRFIGEVAAPVAEDVASALSSISGRAFDVKLKGCGQFGSETPRAIWAGVDANPALEHLHKKIDRAVQRIGLAPDKRKFMPHVTLARLRSTPSGKVQQFVEEHGLYSAPPFAVDSFGLYSSELSHTGSIYHLEQSYRLTRTAA